MDRNEFLAVILLVLVISDGSDAALLGNFRIMVGLEPDGKARSTQISPSPGPITEKGSDLNNVNSNVSTAKNPKISPTPGNPTKGDPRGSTDTRQERIDEKCNASSINMCHQKILIACLLLQHPENKEIGLQEFFLLVQNEGDSNLEVNITVPDSVKMDLKQLQIPKHQAKKINASVNVGGSSTITLSAGSGECVLHTGVPIPQGNFFSSFPQIPSYTTLVHPIYGAYFLFVIALIVGGSWACCKFGKRGQQRGIGVPYQELEMGSGSAVNVETADGWDQSWDDNWDEEKAVKSPGGQRTGNLSANGLTSRNSSRDEWGNGWDD